MTAGGGLLLPGWPSEQRLFFALSLIVLAAMSMCSVVALAKAGTYAGALGAIHETPGARDLPWWAKGALAWQGGKYASRALTSPAMMDAAASRMLDPRTLAMLRYLPRLGTAAYDASQTGGQ